jgi:FtsP/CotA-like multicopper oxidase with cupredoxin domain
LLPAIATNDNRQAAGTMRDGTLTLRLRASEGLWRPEGDGGPALRIQAIGEEGRPLQIPSPLLRVREGTPVVAEIRNELADPLRLFGLCDRAAGKCAAVDVPAGESRHIKFTSGPAGLYHYWATTMGLPLIARSAEDTQLSGAFVVDPRDGEAPSDRVIVVTDWTNVDRAALLEILEADDIGKAFMSRSPKFAFPMNGLLWPHTERFRYQLGERVRWRVINLSTQVHTMHLHGFHFEIEATGDGGRETRYAEGDRQSVVTQLMPAGATLTMSWTPKRAGNWLFHCHVMAHVHPGLRLTPATAHAEHHGAGDPGAGMSGMILGVTVTGPEPASGDVGAAEARRLTLVMATEPARYGKDPAFGFVEVENVENADAPTPGRVPVPGPQLVLERGQPVEITLVNRLPEATAIHWHGMELDSYYDGVHGWSGAGQRMTPMIAPGESFIVRFTPPRAGTFMYHTHLHDNRQLPSGLYGAMIVVDRGAAHDVSVDHTFVIGRGGPQSSALTVVNGENQPPAAVWKAGATHRVRLINITPSDIFSVSLQSGDGPVTWRPVAKDGAALPPSRCQPVSARQTIGVGETYDFEVQAPPGRSTMWLEVRTSGGRWMVQEQIFVK